MIPIGSGINPNQALFLSANLNFQFIYDDDILITDKEDGKPKPMLQMKELFGLGITFKLN